MKIPIRRHPRVPPTGAAKLNKPSVIFRIFPGGKVIPIIATTFGNTKAAPIPLQALAMAKVIILPVQKPLISDQRAHHAPPTITIFLWPYTAPIRPLTSTNAPCVSLELQSVISYGRIFDSRIGSCDPNYCCRVIDTK
jgi:hypothetical protein